VKQILPTISLLLFCLGIWALPLSAAAVSPKDLYHKAEACSGRLLKKEKIRAYRDNWLRCIGKFQAVYREDPSGEWAAAGLYRAGDLYQKLYRYSARESDKREAIDIYNRLVNRYPKSRYKEKAEMAVQTLSRGQSSKPKPKPRKVDRKPSGPAKQQYNLADKCYRRLLSDQRKQKYRDNWLKCIDGFKKVYQYDPSGIWAAAGLYKTAELYQGLHRKSFRDSDLERSREYFNRIIADYPDSSYREKAEKAVGRHGIARPSQKTAVAKAKPKGESTKPSAQKAIVKPSTTFQHEKGVAPASAAGQTTVTGLRYWSNPSYTRIVIDLDGKAGYIHRLLKRDPSIHKPQRLYVDIQKSQLGKSIERIIPIDDDLLSNARAGQHTADAVRVVVDIKSFETYNIFPLNNPFRIVIDVRGKRDAVGGRPSAPSVEAKAKPGKAGGKVAPGAIAKQLALGVKRIVIDPGHGGRDYGAPGYLKNVHEKHIVLQISKRLATKIRQKLGCEVILTRSTDKYLTLEERTAIANTENADLFISIHTNSARDRRAYGVMTFILNLATDDEAILVAARENATSTKNIGDLQTILSDLMQNVKIEESSRLAGRVQKSTVQHMSKHYSRIKNKGVKQAPFYVLLGAQMPSILVETSFISNPRECKRLVTGKYQEQMAEGIFQGIKAYIRETNPTALLSNKAGTGT